MSEDPKQRQLDAAEAAWSLTVEHCRRGSRAALVAYHEACKALARAEEQRLHARDAADDHRRKGPL